MQHDKLIYAIGDIHGDLDQLQGIHARILSDLAEHRGREHIVVHIGDLIDRRPDSKGVIAYLIAGINAQKPWIVLKGNHDRYLQWFLEDPHRRDPRMRPDYTWLHPRLGGAETLKSYGVMVAEGDTMGALHAEAKDKIPQSHYDFISQLPLSYETSDLFFVHAGVNPQRGLYEQSEDDLLTIRDEFLIHTANYEKLIIHGHTVIDTVTHYGNRINIDTGAAWGDTLSAIVIDDGQVSSLTASGRLELSHPKSKV